MKKHIFIFAIFLLLISTLTVFCYASFGSTYTFLYEDREIVVEGEFLTQSEAQEIADFIVYGITPSGSQGIGVNSKTPLLCILFGHSITTYTAFETIHYVYTESPKCVRNLYSVETCTRENCDYFVKTLTDSYRISSCHG